LGRQPNSSLLPAQPIFRGSSSTSVTGSTCVSTPSSSPAPRCAPPPSDAYKYPDAAARNPSASPLSLSLSSSLQAPETLAPAAASPHHSDHPEVPRCAIEHHLDSLILLVEPREQGKLQSTESNPSSPLGRSSPSAMASPSGLLQLLRPVLRAPGEPTVLPDPFPLSLSPWFVPAPCATVRRRQ
jgi:hypothetical protein